MPYTCYCPLGCTPVGREEEETQLDSEPVLGGSAECLQKDAGWRGTGRRPQEATGFRGETGHSQTEMGKSTEGVGLQGSRRSPRWTCELLSLSLWQRPRGRRAGGRTHKCAMQAKSRFAVSGRDTLHGSGLSVTGDTVAEKRPKN